MWHISQQHNYKNSIWWPWRELEQNLFSVGFEYWVKKCWWNVSLSDLELSYLNSNRPYSLEFLLTLLALRPDYVQPSPIITKVSHFFFTIITMTSHEHYSISDDLKLDFLPYSTQQQRKHSNSELLVLFLVKFTFTSRRASYLESIF